MSRLSFQNRVSVAIQMDKISPSHLYYYIDYWRYRLKSARHKKKEKPQKSVNLPHLLAVISAVLLYGAKKSIFFHVRLLTETCVPPTYGARLSGTPTNRVPDMRSKQQLVIFLEAMA